MRSYEEIDQVQNKVQSLVSMYENLMKEHNDVKEENKVIISKKEKEIQNLNESVECLSKQLKDYDQNSMRLNEEASIHITKISSLELTVSELSMVTKEKEVVETMMQDELKQRDVEISKLEGNLEEVESRMDEVLKDRDAFIEALEEERGRADELNDRVKELECNLKEREVVQQFLEKELASREAEVSIVNYLPTLSV